jgi:hypothetical protein
VKLLRRLLPRWTFARWMALAVAFGTLAQIYGAALVGHVRNSSDPALFNDDARNQIFHFDRVRDPALFPHDYLGEYAVDCMAPGYRALYTVGSMFVDPRGISKVLPYVLLAIVVGAVFVGAMKWGSVAAAWVAAALCLSTEIYLDRMGGGLPRSFAFPILACAAAALLHGRMTALAVVVAVGAAFYPAAAMPAGMALALVLLVLPARARGSARGWSRGRRWLTVMGTVLAAAVFLTPTSLSLRKYGGYIRPTDLAAYPEAGPGGRFFAGDRPPWRPLVPTILEEAHFALSGAGQPWSQMVAEDDGGAGRARNQQDFLYVVLGMTFVAFARFVFVESSAARLSMLLVAAIAGSLIAKPFAPYFYLPQRYIGYPLPILLALMIPGGAYALLLGTRAGGRPWMRSVCALTGGLACLLLLGGRGSPTAGLTVRVDARAPLYRFISSLPKDVLIAGWPSTSTTDNIPYITHRQALVTFETHVAFQKGYVETLRARTKAFISAYFAADLRPLETLRDDFGVTHLVVDTRNLQGKPPDYFRPFDAWIKTTVAHNEPLGYVIPRILSQTEVFHDGTTYVLDLKKLPAPAQEAAAP